MIELNSAYAATTHSADVVFALWVDPGSWPTWDPDVSWVTFDGPSGLGGRGKLKPRSGPSVSFVVTGFEQERLFTDTARLPGAQLEFEHTVLPADDGSEVAVRIRLHGALAPVWRRVMGRGLRNAVGSSLSGLLAHLDG